MNQQQYELAQLYIESLAGRARLLLIVFALLVILSLWWLSPHWPAWGMAILAGIVFAAEPIIYVFSRSYQKKRELVGTLVRGVSVAIAVLCLVTGLGWFRQALGGVVLLSGPEEVWMMTQLTSVGLVFTSAIVLVVRRCLLLQ